MLRQLKTLMCMGTIASGGELAHDCDLNVDFETLLFVDHIFDWQHSGIKDPALPHCWRNVGALVLPCPPMIVHGSTQG